MKLTPREIDHLVLHQCGFLAQKRLARGLKLNYTEATALIATVVLELIRDGKTCSELMSEGRKLLGKNQVQSGVDSLVDEVQVEGTFPDGTKLVTVHSPITQEDGDLSKALYGSFLPVPPLTLFGAREDQFDLTNAPGAVVNPASAPIELNAGRPIVWVTVSNTADRPIQVGSHYHMVEANARLEMDRGIAYGKRLNIPAGTAVRFEPGDKKLVPLVEIAGHKVILGGNGIVDGPYAPGNVDAVVRKCQERGFKHKAEDALPKKRKSDDKNGPATMERAAYSAMFGPTTGDLVHLGDTGLMIEVERDFTVYGDECKFGGGKTLRDGMGQAAGSHSIGCLDCVITNVLVVDYTGIYKCDVGIKDGKIAGMGKAGNPDVMDGVSPGMVVGPGTEAIAGEGSILTAGGLDTHIHFICPQQCNDAIASGITTMYGGGSGPATGTNATTCTDGPFYIKKMLQATDNIPLNFGFSGKGNASKPEGVREMIQAGCAGLKLHEDWGTTPAAIDACLNVAEEFDIQVTIHTDTLNESCCVEDSIAAFKGRTIHTYHSEGAGGGHAPDIIKVCGDPNIIPSSTNPTRPYTVNTIDEHVDMLMVCHHLDTNIAEDVAFAESRIRATTIQAEDILHDMGAISIMSSDSQAMGRIGEVVGRTWQTASKMKMQRGQLPEDKGTSNDNTRVKRFIAKYTINPAIAHGMSHLIGSIEVGKIADLVLWSPAFFGSKPDLVMKGGFIAWAQMGDPNASIPTPQPVMMRPMFAAYGAKALGSCCFAFVSEASIANGTIRSYGLEKQAVAVKNCRNIGKRDMKLNDKCPTLSVHPEKYIVTCDGQELKCEPAHKLPLAQRYFLF